jgi:2-oxoglutarate dehydrogenase complex dehydrogenase (E1) component-like enzyme
MGCMGKTIALKLTEKEEKIVAQFNKQGISNSNLLRNALRQYINTLPEYTAIDPQMKNVFIKDENEQTNFSKSLKELKQEMERLREQMRKTQKQVESNVMAFQRRLYLLSLSTPLSEQIPTPIKLDIIQEIHQQVDEFLNKRLENKGA